MYNVRMISGFFSYYFWSSEHTEYCVDQPQFLISAMSKKVKTRECLQIKSDHNLKLHDSFLCPTSCVYRKTEIVSNQGRHI